jgi:hypothetical protein
MGNRVSDLLCRLIYPTYLVDAVSLLTTSHCITLRPANSARETPYPAIFCGRGLVVTEI